MINGTLLKSKNTVNTTKAPRYPTMHIYNCPHEIGNSELKDFMSSYCKPVRIWSGKFKTPPFTNILNGVRHMSFKFSIDHDHIPKFLFIKRHRIKISYDGQPRHQVECYHCRELGHISKSCTNPPKCGITGCKNDIPHTRQECTHLMKKRIEQQRKEALERQGITDSAMEAQDTADIDNASENITGDKNRIQIAFENHNKELENSFLDDLTDMSLREDNSESEKAQSVVDIKSQMNADQTSNTDKVDGASNSVDAEQSQGDNQNQVDGDDANIGARNNNKKAENKLKLNNFNSRGSQVGATHQRLPPPAPVKVVGQTGLPVVRNKVRPGPYSSKSSPSRNLKEV